MQFIALHSRSIELKCVRRGLADELSTTAPCSDIEPVLHSVRRLYAPRSQE